MSDLIDRQKAIDALKRAEALTMAFGYHNVIETIRELPSVQPTRPTPSNTLYALDCVDRTEAIKAVKFYETFCDPYPRVIEALEELPSVHLELSNNSPKLDHKGDVPDINVGDMISRQAAIDVVIKRDANCGIDSAEVLKLLPSVQPRKGKISYTKFCEELWGQSSICNLCGCSWQIANNGHDNYCPNCGARMEEGDSDEA